MLAVISKHRMRVRIEKCIEELRVLHKMAIDPAARKNLKRAMISAQNALQVFMSTSGGTDG